MRTRRQWTEAEVGWLRKHYPDTLNAECAAHLGRTMNMIRGYASYLGLRKSARYMATVYRALLVRSRNALMASERRRWKNDLPQKTRIHFSNQSDAKMGWRYRMRKAGYVEFDGDKNKMYYPDGIERHPKMEATGRKYNIIVLPLSERINKRQHN